MGRALVIPVGHVCTLRGAVEEADLLPAGDTVTIVLSSANYPLSLGEIDVTTAALVTISAPVVARSCANNQNGVGAIIDATNQARIQGSSM